MGWLLIFLATISELVGVYGLNLYNRKRNLLGSFITVDFQHRLDFYIFHLII